MLQYNTSFASTEWFNVVVKAQREVSASLENRTEAEMNQLILVRKFESKSV